MIRAQADEIQSLIIQLRRARAASSAPASDNANALREKNAQIAQLRTQLDVQAKQLKKLEAAAKSSGGNPSAELQAQIDQYKGQVSQQERQIADLNRQISSLNGNISTRDTTISSLQNEKSALSQQVADLRQQTEQLNAQVSSLSKGSVDAQQLAAGLHELQ